MPRLKNIKRPWLGGVAFLFLLGVVAVAVVQAVMRKEGGKGIFGNENKEVDFAGTYKVTGRGGQTILDIAHAGSGYAMKWTLDDDRIYYGNGVQVGEVLGAVCDMGDGKTCGIAAYKKQGKEISGLWAFMNDDKVFTEQTQNAAKLKTSEQKIAGTYTLEGQNPNSSAYKGKITFRRTGRTYETLWEFDDERSLYGTSLTLENVLVAGYSNKMGVGVVLYVMEGEEIEGRWLYSDFARLATNTDIRLGSERILRQD